MSQHSHAGAKLKRRWIEFWGLVFFAGILVNFAEIVCRTLFHFSIDLMYDLPVWLTIWAVMMVAGPILPDGDHVSVDMLRNALPGPPARPAISSAASPPSRSAWSSAGAALSSFPNALNSI